MPRFLTRIFLFSLFACVAGGPATAQASAETDLQRFALGRVGSDPAEANVVRAGETVELEFSGVWRDGCVPAVLGLQGEGGSRVLRLRSERQSFCTQMMTPFALRLPPLRFEASDVGLLRVAVIADDIDWLATLELRVIGAEDATAEALSLDVGGLWYSPERSGSGLNLVQTEAGALSGLWFNFSPNGAPSWFLLADAEWTSPRRAEGAVYRMQASPFACTLQMPNPDCELGPVASANRQQVGGFSLEFDSAGEARLSFNQPGSNGQPVDGRTHLLQRLR